MHDSDIKLAARVMAFAASLAPILGAKRLALAIIGAGAALAKSNGLTLNECQISLRTGYDESDVIIKASKR